MSAGSAPQGRFAQSPLMTPEEARTSVRWLCKEIGERAEIGIRLSSGTYDEALTASVYALGSYPEALTFSVKANTFAALLDAIWTKWVEYRDEHACRMTEAMALEIIRITDAFGACTDASLRGARYSASDIARFGASACLRAAEMASKGPFEIVTGALANEVAA